jgi:hypothetical protein
MLVDAATRQFIREHRNDDVRQLALKRADGINLTFALQQIDGWQKAKTKLPSWAASDEIVYPRHLNMEQCSSEQTAIYKKGIAERIFQDKKPESMVDITGGFGVDFAFLSQAFNHATYIECDESLFNIISHNLKALKLQNVEAINTDGVEFLQQMDKATMLFIDPARRDAAGGKVAALKDCTPDVISMISTIYAKTDYCLLKLSPMLDWHKAIADLGKEHVLEVHIVSVKNECKELLILLKSCEVSQTTYYCTNDEDTFSFTDYNPSASIYDGLPETIQGKYLYEPNASIMKSGSFGNISQRHNIKALSKDSHLFVSDCEIDFPGRKFIVEGLTTMNKRAIKQCLNDIKTAFNQDLNAPLKANISTRNFPLSVAELRKRLKIKDGGNIYIFATTLSQNQHYLIICRK